MTFEVNIRFSRHRRNTRQIAATGSRRPDVGVNRHRESIMEIVSKVAWRLEDPRIGPWYIVYTGSYRTILKHLHRSEESSFYGICMWNTAFALFVERLFHRSRTAILATRLTTLSNKDPFLVLIPRILNLLSLVRYDSSVAHLTYLRSNKCSLRDYVLVSELHKRLPSPVLILRW